MPTFTGRLTVFGNQSTLSTPSTTFLILKAGVSDPAQAQFAATFYLLQTAQLHPGQLINVLGNSGTVGTVSAIAMTSASAASPSPFGIAPMHSLEQGGGTKKGGVKKGSKKAVSKKGTKKSTQK